MVTITLEFNNRDASFIVKIDKREEAKGKKGHEVTQLLQERGVPPSKAMSEVARAWDTGRATFQTNLRPLGHP